MQDTPIQWTDKTLNFLRGCQVISAGCEQCYAKDIAARFSGVDKSGKKLPYFGLAKFVTDGKRKESRWTGDVTFDLKTLMVPIFVKRPTKFFVNSMADLFYEKVTDRQIDLFFAMAALAQRHTFQVLTKRSERLREYFNSITKEKLINRWSDAAYEFCLTRTGKEDDDDTDAVPCDIYNYAAQHWPLPNVHIGVSVEDQASAEKRIPHLVTIPNAVPWVSYEPAIGGVDFTDIRIKGTSRVGLNDLSFNALTGDLSVVGAGPHGERVQINVNENPLKWVVCGGESGPKARPCNVDWLLSAVDQAQKANVTVFVKQMGARCYFEVDFDDFPPDVFPKVTIDEPNNRVSPIISDKHGAIQSEMPEALRVRQWPEVGK